MKLNLTSIWTEVREKELLPHTTTAFSTELQHQKCQHCAVKLWWSHATTETTDAQSSHWRIMRNVLLWCWNENVPIDCNYLPVLWTTGWIISSSPSWHWLPQKNVNQLFTHRSGSILKNKTLWLSEACRFKWANISIVMNKRWYFIVTLEVSDNNKPFCDGVRGPCLQRSKFCGWIGKAFLFSQ